MAAQEYSKIDKDRKAHIEEFLARPAEGTGDAYVNALEEAYVQNCAASQHEAAAKAGGERADAEAERARALRQNEREALERAKSFKG